MIDKDQITEGSKWSNGDCWIKVERIDFLDVSYNVSSSTQCPRGSCKCSIYMFCEIIILGDIEKIYGNKRI